eukprot:CAMPEP_0185756636 /NCGR_PEP_ID=MMETSP1174-20130828/15062_1 /TAXON_ID=35687 /ORGANISM="Dictyocha speculum, Strain CCMP1381" /LENGTH=72 /DNA_ID=CAMNT_0028435691 /DNA_START=23 /DNA_END=241 /DNA_ORIENTATION=-
MAFDRRAEIESRIRVAQHAGASAEVTSLMRQLASVDQDIDGIEMNALNSSASSQSITKEGEKKGLRQRHLAV